MFDEAVVLKIKKWLKSLLRYDFKDKHWIEISREKGCQYDIVGYENNVWPKYVSVLWNKHDGRVKKVAELVYSRTHLFLCGGYVCQRHVAPRENEIVEVEAKGRAENEKEARLLSSEIIDTDFFYSGYR